MKCPDGTPTRQARSSSSKGLPCTRKCASLEIASSCRLQQLLGGQEWCSNNKWGCSEGLVIRSGVVAAAQVANVGRNPKYSASR
jgi:hypothetical protein